MGLLEQFAPILFFDALIISLVCVVGGLIHIIWSLVKERRTPDVSSWLVVAIGLLLGGVLYTIARSLALR